MPSLRWQPTPLNTATTGASASDKGMEILVKSFGPLRKSSAYRIQSQSLSTEREKDTAMIADTPVDQFVGVRRAVQEDIPYLLLACRASLVDASCASDISLVDEIVSGRLEGFVKDDEEGYCGCLVVSQSGKTAMVHAVLRTAENPHGLITDACDLVTYTVHVLKDRGVEKVWAHVPHRHPKAVQLLKLYAAMGLRPVSTMIEMEV